MFSYYTYLFAFLLGAALTVHWKERVGWRETGKGGERAGERERGREREIEGGRREREREKVIVGVWEEGRKEGRNHQNFSLG